MPSFKSLTLFILSWSANEVYVNIIKANKVDIDISRTKRDRELIFGMNTSIIIIFIQNEIWVPNSYGFGIIYKLEISKNNSWSNLYKDNDQTIRARSVIFGMDTYIIYRSMHIKYHIAASHHLLLISHNLQTNFCNFLSNFEKSRLKELLG